MGQEDNDSDELTEEPWNYARGDTLEDTKWHQLKIGALKYFSTLKSDRYKTRPWRGKKEIHPIGKETRSALLNLGSLLKKSMEERGQLIGAVIGPIIGTLFCIDFGDMEL